MNRTEMRARANVLNKYQFRIFLLYAAAYWENAQLLLKVLHLLYQRGHALVARHVPGTRLRATPRPTGQDAVGELTTERAGELTLIHRKALKNLIILKNNNIESVYD